jgi:hypothetical protein
MQAVTMTHKDGFRILICKIEDAPITNPLKAHVCTDFLNPCPVTRLPPVTKDARCGVTLIEAVLFISVALGLIVGGLVFYQQASRAATYQGVVRGLQAVQGEDRAPYQVQRGRKIAAVSSFGQSCRASGLSSAASGRAAL